MLRTAVAFTVVLTFYGCDKDFETIGSDIIGAPGFSADLYDEAVISFTNNDLGPVQTNNLPVNLLGVYTHSFYGLQTADILTQVNLSIPDPDFGDQPVLDSVVLRIPYFYTTLEPEEGETDETIKYDLDSIYGSDPIKLSIIESNFFLNEFDPETGFEESQKYYSNIREVIEGNLGLPIYENESFIPSDQDYEIYGENDKGEDDTLTLPPQIRIKLPVEYFQSRIIDKGGSSELSSESSFKDYFRGLYIDTEPINGSGNLMILELEQADAGIYLYYTSLEKDTGDLDDDGDTEEKVRKPDSYKLNFGPDVVNGFVQEVPALNDENIYLKGGEGSMAIIELFDGPDADGNGISDELEFLRMQDWLINEANLIFYVNQQLLGESNEPEHIYLYDLNNNRMLVDYTLDSQGVPNGMESKTNLAHLNPLEKDEDGDGLFYKVRITEHIQNLINKDSTNVKLGLVVSQNINIISNAAVLSSGITEVEMVPTGSVVSPEATILYGPKAQNEEKQLRLKIYYSEPKE